MTLPKSSLSNFETVFKCYLSWKVYKLLNNYILLLKDKTEKDCTEYRQSAVEELDQN